MNKIIEMNKKKNLTIKEIFALAVKNHQENNLKVAENYYKEILKINPNHIDTHNNLGTIFKETGEVQKALSCYEKAIELNPNYANAYINLGATLKELGKSQKAISCFKKSIELNPNHADAHSNLGAALNESGESQKAISCYERAIEINPNHANAYYNLGIVFKESRELQKAMNCFQKAIVINPNHANAHSNLGAVLNELGEPQKAKSCYERAIEINPNYADAYNNLGIIFEELGETQKAKSCYEKTIELNPNHTAAYNNLGIVFQALGKQTKAVENYQEALIKRSGINYEVKKELRPATTSFFLELTNKCNFHCEFCPSDSQTRLQGFMDLSLVKKIFDEIALKKLVTDVQLHLMGEPTLHPKLNDILAYAKKKKVKIALTTNGSTLVEKRVPKLLESINGKIVASLMTPTKETYKIRGDVGLNWDRYLNNFRLLIREHLKRISEGKKIEYKILIRVMVSEKSKKGAIKILESSKDIQENWNEWSEFVKNTEKQLGLKSFKRPKIDSNVVLSLLSDYREVSYNLQRGLSLQFWKAFTFANSRVSDDYELKYQKGNQYCPHPFTDFGVLWNGDVSLCCLDHDATLKVGDVRNHSIETVLNSTAAQKLRGSMYSLEALHPTCQKCQARPVEKVLKNDQ